MASTGNTPKSRFRRLLAALIAEICRWLFVVASGFAADLSPLIVKAREEKDLVWYTTASAGDNQAIIAGFTRKYPFLKVQALRTTGEKLRFRWQWPYYGAKHHSGPPCADFHPGFRQLSLDVQDLERRVDLRATPLKS
jgi:hypothetical protein